MTACPSRCVTVFQPALPAYRVDFFDRLARHYGEGFSVHYSPTDMGALTSDVPRHDWEHPLGLMRPLTPGLEWQTGALRVPIKRGDTLVVCGGPRTVSTLVLLVKARIRGARTIWFGHYWSNSSKLHRFLLRMMLMKLAHAVLFYADQEVGEYRSGFGKSDRRLISAANNGINVDPIAALRVPYRAAERPRDMMVIGRIFAKNRIDLIIQALTDARLAGVRLHVFGDGPAGAEMQALARDLGVADSIIWHGGTIDEEVISQVANQCRLFVFPGAVGLSLIHAMAYGLPALVGDDRWGNGPEITAFDDGITGRAFIQNNGVDLAGKIVAMIDDEKSLDRWAEESRLRADQQFNTQCMSTRVIKLVDAVGHGI